MMMPNREIKRTSQFKRDFKNLRYDRKLVEELSSVIADLSADIPLSKDKCDHALHGIWEGFRDCHIRPDVVLIYQKIDNQLRVLLLARVGSHSKLF